MRLRAFNSHARPFFHHCSRLRFVILIALLAQLLAPLVSPPTASAAGRASSVSLGGPLAHGTLGEPYRYRFAVAGSPAPQVYLDSGSLPLGLALSPDGTISGVPVNGGEYHFSLRAANGVGAEVVHSVTLVIDEPATSPSPIAAEPSAAQSIATTSTAPSTTDAGPWAAASSFFGSLFGWTSGQAPVVADPPQAATPTFGVPTNLPGGGSPTQVATADFNGDGKPDLAASNSSSPTASVWLNTTPASASSPSFGARTDLPIGSTGSWGVAAADFTMDGKPDLLVADGVRSIAGWANTTGAGAASAAFGTRSDTPTNLLNPHALAVGDFNTDGKPDVAATSYENGAGTKIAVLLNLANPATGKLDFAAPFNIAVPAGPAGIAAADLNDDGKTDLVVSSASTVGVLLNTASAGAAVVSFGARTDFALPAAGWGVRAADLNADGKPDLVVGHNAGTTSASVYLNSANSGATTPSFFARADVGAQSSGHRDVAPADFNADGRIDLASRANGPAIRVFASSTNSGATAPTFANPVALSAGNGNGGIAAADLNGDSKPDLVAPNAADNTISLFVNGSGATPLPTITPIPSPTSPPVPGDATYRDVGNVRVWAKSFVTSGAETVATGTVGIGATGSNAPFYTVGTSASWDNGPLTLLGTLGIVNGATLAAGAFSVDRTSGAVTWGLGVEVVLDKLGTSSVTIDPTITVNVLQPKAQVSALVALNLPENAGTTITIVFELGANNEVTSKQGAHLVLKLAGCAFVADVAASTDGLFGNNAQLTLPLAWNSPVISISSVALANNTITLGDASGTFSIPDRTLGKVVKLSGVSGQLQTDNGSYKLAIKASTVTFTIGTDSTTVNDVSFTVANGAITATLGALALKVAGLNVAAGQLAYANGSFTAASAKLTLPAAWKSAAIDINGLTITNDGVSLGGAGGSFPIPNQTLGKVVKLSGMTGKLNVDGAGAYSIAVTAGQVTFTAGTGSASANTVLFTIANGAPSATIGALTLKVAGLNVATNQLAYANGSFTAATALISFPAAWKGITASVNGLKITNDLLSIGAAGSAFPIPDVTLGDSGVLKLTKITGALGVDGDGDYKIAVAATVAISKVQTTGGGSGLTVAGNLSIKNGQIDGTVSGLAFKISGVDFSATGLKFVNDKLVAQEAKLTLPIKGSSASAKVKGLELGGSAGFKLQGAKITLPDFKIGTVGVKGAMIEFQKLADGSYLVGGGAKFDFEQFAVTGSFKIGYAPASGVALKSVSLEFKGSIPAPSIPLGSTGFNIVRISGGFDMSDGSATVKLGLGAASIVGVGGVSLLALDADVTIQIKPTFALDAHAGAKVIGIKVASVDLHVSPTAFSLKGEITIAVIKASLEITFGKDASGQFTFYGAVKVGIVIPRGYFCSDDDFWCPTFPKSDVTLANAALEGGKFKKNSDVIWGARGSFSVWLFDLYAWAKFAPGTDYGLGDKLVSYAPVKPVGVNAATLAASGDPYLVTVTKPAEYLMVMETVAEANRAAPEELAISAPNGVQFTKRLGYSEPDGSLRIYRLDFADPQAAVGTWTLATQTGNIAGMLGAAPTPKIDNLSACINTACLAPDKPLVVDNGQLLDVAWAASAAEPGLTMDLYAQSATGLRYQIGHQETATEKALAGNAAWTLGLPSGSYTITAQLESDGFAPVKREQGVVTINDITAPAAPTGLAATADAGMAAIATWNGTAAEADVAGYQVSVDGGEPIATSGRLSEYVTYGLEAGVEHTLSVAAYDLSGNVGPASTVSVVAPTFGVTAAWPMRDSMSTTVSEVGASFNTPITFGSLRVVDAAGAAVSGTVTTLTGEASLTETVTLGATFAPASGTLAPGSYTATISAQDDTGATASYSWTFTIFAELAPEAGPEPYRLLLPLLTR